MGAQGSKPDSPQTWKASGPSGISQDLLESLQSSNETDASRSRQAEIQIQSRVASELKKVQKQESEALKAAHAKIAASSDKAGGEKDDSQSTSFTVSKEIEALRQKLEAKKKLRALPDSVEGARNELVRCLRENDRRPLDCWQEVETFKTEVKRLEKGWIEKVTQ